MTAVRSRGGDELATAACDDLRGFSGMSTSARCSIFWRSILPSLTSRRRRYGLQAMAMSSPRVAIHCTALLQKFSIS